MQYASSVDLYYRAAYLMNKIKSVLKGIVEGLILFPVIGITILVIIVIPVIIWSFLLVAVRISRSYSLFMALRVKDTKCNQ